MIKLLGRRGVMTTTLVSSPEKLPLAAPLADALLGGYAYLPGNTYAEYVPGTDKLAKYGLTALVVGGGAAALIKSGLLARFWKPLLVALAALGARAALLPATYARKSAGGAWQPHCGDSATAAYVRCPP